MSQLQSQPPVLEYSTERRSRTGMGFLAVAASMLLPGLGHLVVCDRPGAKRWFAMFLAMLALTILIGSVPALVPAILLLIPIGFAVQIATWVSAFRAAKRSERVRFRSAIPRFACGLLLLLIAVLSPFQYLLWPWKRYVVEAFAASTASMSPTLVARDRFLVHKLREFKRFDIVLIDPANPRTPPNDFYVKRIVGFPGETIEIKNGGVSVNGQVLRAPSGITYVSPRPNGTHQIPFGNGVEGNPITLGPDEYFFLGDNSPISGDSRYWDWSVDGHQPGALPRSHIKGVVTWIYWPISRWRRLY